MSDAFDDASEITTPYREAAERGLPWVRAAQLTKSIITGAHETNRELAQAYVRSLVPRVCAELARGGGIDAFLPEINRKVIELRAAPAPITPDSEISRVAATLGHLGWAPLEIDLLRAMLVLGQVILEVDVYGVDTSTGRISRVQLRERSRPITWTNIESWEKQFRGYNLPE
jgi:hypothetical protein